MMDVVLKTFRDGYLRCLGLLREGEVNGEESEEARGGVC